MRAQKFSPQRTLLLAAVLVAAGISTYVQVFAHAIDYLAMTIVPSATFNGNSGNVTVTDTVAGGSDITFDLKYSIGRLPHEHLMRAIELYGTQVIPRVRELLAEEPVAQEAVDARS